MKVKGYYKFVETETTRKVCKTTSIIFFILLGGLIVTQSIGSLTLLQKSLFYQLKIYIMIVESARRLKLKEPLNNKTISIQIENMPRNTNDN